MFHVKDAEFNATGRAGVYGGYQGWVDRPGRSVLSVTGRLIFVGSLAN